MMAQRLPLLVRELPVRVPRFTFSVAWNEQLARDAAHRWFRSLVEAAAAEAFAPGPTKR